jgi:uracil-DNA glycosylase
MSQYLTALDATEAHVQALKTSGVRYLNVQSDTLLALQRRASALQPKAPARREIETATELPKPSLPVITSAPAVEISKPEMPKEKKEEAMAELRGRALVCVKCPHLVKTRRNVVFGVGDIHTRLMFVGEAPGADEDAQGEPFVGAAGQLLTKIIKAMGYSRESVYIANVLKCRPDMPEQSSGNRKPTPEEMRTCLPYLLEQIELIKPAVIVALGATAIEGLLGKSEGIGKMRGRFLTFRDTPLMPTFHPAYLLRNQAMTEKRKVWEDMLQVLEKLGAEITEKQRGFFLKGS